MSLIKKIRKIGGARALEEWRKRNADRNKRPKVEHESKTMHDARMYAADCTGLRARFVKFNGAHLQGSKWDNANIAGADFSGAWVERMDIRKACGVAKANWGASLGTPIATAKQLIIINHQRAEHALSRIAAEDRLDC